MAGLLAAAPMRPRVLSVEVLLHRAIALFRAEHPDLSDALFLGAWVDATDATFTAWRELIAPRADHEDAR